jgi:hypothetical protein
MFVTSDHHAGLIFENDNVRLNLLHKGGSDYDVGVSKIPGRRFLSLLRSPGIEDEGMADVLPRSTRWRFESRRHGQPAWPRRIRAAEHRGVNENLRPRITSSQVPPARLRVSRFFACRPSPPW